LGASSRKLEGQKNVLITHIKVTDFMCIDELDQDTGNLVAFGDDANGKSARLVAVLVGLGYDVMLEALEETKGASSSALLCGWPLRGTLNAESNCWWFMSARTKVKV
jgi:hypothetical protein